MKKKNTNSKYIIAAVVAVVVVLGVAAYFGLGEQLQGRLSKNISPSNRQVETVKKSPAVKARVVKEVEEMTPPGMIDSEMPEYRPPGTKKDSTVGTYTNLPDFNVSEPLGQSIPKVDFERTNVSSNLTGGYTDLYKLKVEAGAGTNVVFKKGGLSYIHFLTNIISESGQKPIIGDCILKDDNNAIYGKTNWSATGSTIPGCGPGGCITLPFSELALSVPSGQSVNLIVTCDVQNVDSGDSIETSFGAVVVYENLGSNDSPILSRIDEAFIKGLSEMGSSTVSSLSLNI